MDCITWSQRSAGRARSNTLQDSTTGNDRWVRFVKTPAAGSVGKTGKIYRNDSGTAVVDWTGDGISKPGFSETNERAVAANMKRLRSLLSKDGADVSELGLKEAARSILFHEWLHAVEDIGEGHVHDLKSSGGSPDQNLCDHLSIYWLQACCLQYYSCIYAWVAGVVPEPPPDPPEGDWWEEVQPGDAKKVLQELCFYLTKINSTWNKGWPFYNPDTGAFDIALPGFTELWKACKEGAEADPPTVTPTPTAVLPVNWKVLPDLPANFDPPPTLPSFADCCPPGTFE